MLNLKKVAVLFARSDSVYKSMNGCDVYDIDRDARSYVGENTVVAHPPCRAWGRLRHFAKPSDDEKDLAFFAVEKVRSLGGVLEHPAGSTLWRVAGLPFPGERDFLGGFTLPIHQFWFGHRAQKNTWLYIKGVEPGSIPVFPLRLGDAEFVVASSKRGAGCKREISKADRERTPLDLAVWLVEVARLAAENG